jgi:Ca-activated chloride channel family protein
MCIVSPKLPIIDLPIGQPHRCLGTLEVTGGTTKKTALPLAGVQISATVADRVASVTIKQTFRNTYAEHLEAVYIFPLSGGCVISDFELRVGDRVVKGIVKERQAAREQYQQALDSGKRAALLEQERDDVFTMQVGNIPPNEEVSVQLVYSERLPFFENGKTEIRLPLVVAPRFIPGEAVERQNVGLGTVLDTNLVPDASRITPPMLAPGVDPKTALSIDVEITPTDAAATSSISELTCSQHATQLALDGGAVKVELSHTDERLNRDFVLSWRLSEKSVKSSLVVYRGPDGAEYGMLSVMPPKRDGFLGAPRDVVFVLDRSGSMTGIKMQSAARACALLLNTLGPTDRFAIQAFDNVVEWMLPNKTSSRSGMFFNVDEQTIQKGEDYLRGISARGGTVLDGAISEALQMIKVQNENDKRVPIVVVITDGEVGNEAHVLKRIQHEIGDARLFTVGVDTAVNSGLLTRAANLGGGTATFVAPGADLERALKSVAREIGEPLILDLEITGTDGLIIEKASVAPSNLPDLFAGRAVTGCFKLSGKGSVRVRGRWSDGSAFDEKVKARHLKLPAVAQLWAKAHIVDLEDSFRLTPSDSLRKRIIELSEKHSLLTKFTAFVAVDEAEIVNKTGNLNTVVQPVEQPADWGMLQKQQALHESTGRLKSLSRMTGSGDDALSVPRGAPMRADALGNWGSAGGTAQNQPSDQFLSVKEDRESQQPSQRRREQEVSSSNKLKAEALKDHDQAQEPQTAQYSTDALSCSAPSAPTSGSYGAAASSSLPPQPAQPSQPSQPPPPSASAAFGSAPPVSQPLSHPQSPTSSSIAQSLLGQLNKVGQFFGGSMDDQKAKKPHNPQEREKILVKLKALGDALAVVHNQLLALKDQGSGGTMPASTELELLRKGFVKFLAEADAGTELPILQKFLRVQLKELVQSLNEKDVNAAALIPLWERHLKAFAEAQNETTSYFAGTGSSSNDKFWEHSI